MNTIYTKNNISTVIPQTIIDEIETAVDVYLYVSSSDGVGDKTVDDVCDYILNKDIYLSVPLVRLINKNSDIVETIIRDYYNEVETTDE